ncbi:MAG: hypothetical protein ACW986_16520 [Promethearchaeota archaeon]
MKKVNYSLRFGIVGNREINTELFYQSLQGVAIESNFGKVSSEVFIIFANIPLKLKLFFVETLEELIYYYEEIEKLDVIILTLNLFNSESLYQYFKNIVDEFNETYYFQGISVLVGIDVENIFNRGSSKNRKVSRFSLEDRAKYLNLIYCFEIYNKSKDVREILNKIFKDFVFRFQYSSPELFKEAIIYGKKLVEEYNKYLPL